MAFRFRLAPLLRLRKSMERQRTLQLQDASLRLSRVREALAHVEKLLADVGACDAASMANARFAAELQFSVFYKENLRRHQEQLRAELDRLEQVRQAALAGWREAARERELLETVEAGQRRDYEREQMRHRQRELDAAHLLQRWSRHD